MGIQTYLGDDDKLVLLKGDVLVKGNVNNEWHGNLLKDMRWEGKNYGTVIDGNLTVDGDIVDDNYLVMGVTGSVRCHYLFSKNGRIIINGNLFVTYGIYGEYNDGMLKLGSGLGAGSKLDAPYIFSKDHDMPRKSDVGESIYLEAGNGSERDELAIGQEEGSGWGWNWNYFENGGLMLKDSAFNANDELSVGKFFELVKGGENPFLTWEEFQKLGA